LDMMYYINLRNNSVQKNLLVVALVIVVLGAIHLYVKCTNCNLNDGFSKLDGHNDYHQMKMFSDHKKIGHDIPNENTNAKTDGEDTNELKGESDEESKNDKNNEITDTEADGEEKDELNGESEEEYESDKDDDSIDITLIDSFREYDTEMFAKMSADEIYNYYVDFFELSKKNKGHQEPYLNQQSEEETIAKKNINNKNTSKFADVILAGMFKGGTGTFTNWLTNHPQIYTSNHPSGYYAKDYLYSTLTLEDLKSGLNDTNKVYFERCTICYTSQVARERILAAYPDGNVKLIIMVRDPIERLISAYVQNILNKGFKHNFTLEETVFFPNGSIRCDKHFITDSIYVLHFAKWIQMFPRENILLLDSGNFVKKPWEEMHKVEKFIGIDSFFTRSRYSPNPEKPQFHCIKFDDRDKVRCSGRSKGRPHPKVSNNTTERLKNLFKAYNEQFVTLSGQQFTWSQNYD
ncbi:unnamed protein product, partial [Owenia fusiformis]